MQHIPTQPPEWYEIPQIKFMKNIDPNLTNLEQFYLIKSYDWTDEQIQVDIFCEILGKINSKNPSMIELGSAGVGGSFYSVLFEKWFDGNCTIINVDPRKEMIEEVRTYWKDLHLKNAKLVHGYVGVPLHYQAKPDFEIEKTPYLKVQNLMNENGLNQLDILHADIQGSELPLCVELRSDGIIDKIKYLFISTHFNENENTYYPISEFFSDKNKFKLHFSDPHRGGWGDGLIIVENLLLSNKK
jgi:hypothetical protein